ncbi:ribulose-phosphate 3-epimerase [Nanchangia anserum]|uniref:Ribulose-phosphate 3-epimerase n=1 Tax=Nanchangia anserum TaxID=2692125 RepID=A0A8I0KVC7_9ACTO|nr:ribulose-phosphate 3-epimerase [Nanchangia anserum]MBD3688794.1 ribulose-phosphate 3-epimerase [Nanchangia anserum]QOX82527.1 ribulose-phosphate 3-epimerase [Nanchangia anserum]
MENRIHPSILNCDISALGSEVASISSADAVHVDVMDNHFVPNLSWGLPVVESVVAGPLPVDAHLMMMDPDRWAPAYAEAGCASVTFHLEAAHAPVRLARELHRLGARACLALKPATDIAPVIDLLSEFDMILIMTVEPGFGGQPFLDNQLAKIARTRRAISEANLDVAIQVDGGISRETIERASEAGANVFVAGSAIFRSPDRAGEIAALRSLADHACGIR